jgi:site-specific DNA recombinase
MNHPIRAFIYARKSMDREDRQVHSIDHQLKELRELAVKQNIPVVAELQESQTAKYPGRPVFNQMLSRIRKGEPNCILAWHPDRLARNGVDGSAIVHLIDTRVLIEIKCVGFRFERSPQGLLMLQIEFGMSKYYSDLLSQRVTMACHYRIQDGYWPRNPPLGYIFHRNSLRPRLNKATIYHDRQRPKGTTRLFQKSRFELFHQRWTG